MTSQDQTNYQPTLMQKILGRQYKWWYIFLCPVKSRLSNYFDSALFTIGQMLIILSTILIWWLAGNKQLDASFINKFTYFVIGEIFYAFIFQFCSFFAFEITRGNQTKLLITPSNFFKIIFFSYYGEAFLQNITKLIALFGLAIFLHNLLLPPSIPSLFQVLIFLPISLINLFFLELIASFSGFFNNRVNGYILNYGFLLSLFAGKSFPLNLLIENFNANLANPFAFTFYHPMQIYLGKYSSLETFYVFLGGIAWCIVLYILAKLVFKMGLKKNEAVGL